MVLPRVGRDTQGSGHSVLEECGLLTGCSATAGKSQGHRTRSGYLVAVAAL